MRWQRLHASVVHIGYWLCCYWPHPWCCPAAPEEDAEVIEDSAPELAVTLEFVVGAVGEETNTNTAVILADVAADKTEAAGTATGTGTGAASVTADVPDVGTVARWPKLTASKARPGDPPTLTWVPFHAMLAQRDIMSPTRLLCSYLKLLGSRFD